MTQPRIPFTSALIWIIGSTLLISGGACLGMQMIAPVRPQEKQAPLRVIVQTGPQRQALPTSYLAELMELSVDHLTSVGEFDPRKATAQLLACPVVKEAKVELLRSGIVYVDYAVRRPIALLADYENTALDAEGRAFPLRPFFPPKNLPEIYLGMEGPLNWQQTVKSAPFELACSLLSLFQSSEMAEFCLLKRIDLSRAEEKSLGKREIVLLLEDLVARKEGRWIFPRLLRLSPQSSSQALGNYLQLRARLMEKECLALPPMREGQTLLYCPTKIIDLRLPKMAFIKER